MKLLVTGATGFIGQHLVKSLIEQGHIVLALSRTEELHPADNFPCNLYYLQSSLKLEENAIERIKEFKPDTLIHLAWEKIPDFSFETSFENLQNQIIFFQKIFLVKSLKKIVVTGSCWEYGKKMGICKETDVCVSNNYFTWAKNSLREFLEFESFQKNINFVWSRVFYVYGPKQRKGSLIPSVIEKIQNGLLPELKTPYNSNDFIYIDDVVDGLIQFAVNNVPSGIYNLGNGESVPIIDVVSKIEKKLNGKQILTSSVLENTLQSSLKDTDFWADMFKTFTILKWQPKINLELGIEKSINLMK